MPTCEVLLWFGLRYDQRELQHSSVDRDRIAVVAGVPELPQCLHDGDGVVGHQATDVPEPEPAVSATYSER